MQSVICYPTSNSGSVETCMSVHIKLHKLFPTEYCSLFLPISEDLAKREPLTTVNVTMVDSTVNVSTANVTTVDSTVNVTTANVLGLELEYGLGYG